MHIHYILHAPFEKLGTIETWIEKNRHASSGTHTYRGEKLPDISQFDMLIVMGGPQSAVKLDNYPYLRDEVRLVQETIHANKPVLGICLGAQLIGVALGADAERSPNREIGVYPVRVTADAGNDPLFRQFPEQFDVMHWHNDMPGMAAGSVCLAGSEGCPRQAFRFGDRVYGLQFHLELTPSAIQEMVENCREDLDRGQYIQTAEQLLNLDLTEINQKMHLILDYLAAKAAS
jgi:GMP synthase (glutamine-hydrolysing)